MERLTYLAAVSRIENRSIATHISAMPRSRAADSAGDRVDVVNGPPPQYVARPPEMSKVKPVVKEHSSETMKAMVLAISSTSTSRPRGIFDSM